MVIDRRKNFLEKFKNVIKEHKNELPITFNNKNINIQTNSWFDIIENKCIKTKQKDITLKLENKINSNSFRCKKIKMILTKKQKEIINSWLDSCTEMYNKTLRFIKMTYPFTRSNIVKKYVNEQEHKNFMKIRNKVKEIKDSIKQKSNKIYTHTLDYTIKQLCTNFFVSEKNLVNGYIKRFRIKYWNKNRKSKTLTIEKSCFQQNNKLNFYGLSPKIFGKIKYSYNGKDYLLTKNKIKHNVCINYNDLTKEYLLLIPKENKISNNNQRRQKVISLDPGLRTFITGLDNNNSIKIGTNTIENISKGIKKLKELKISNIPMKIKKKNEARIEKKIKNKVDDLHWKTIKYLTQKYDNILLGDMSAKSIISKNNKVLHGMIKDICERIRFYQFKQRLEYKCESNNVNFLMVNEYYTSKTCSNCGNYNENLGGNKIYNCKKCKKIFDRDVNACRNIYMKALIE